MSQGGSPLRYAYSKPMAGSVRGRGDPGDRRAAQPWLLAGGCAAAATFLGAAIHISLGEFDGEALAALTIALAAAAVGVALGDRLPSRLPSPSATTVGRVAAVGLGLGLIYQFALLAEAPTDSYFQTPQPQLELAFQVAIVAAGVLSVATLLTAGRSQRLLFVAAVAVFLGLGITVVASGPNSQIDVWMFQHNASVGLLNGQDPYSITYPDLYPGTDAYAPGLVRDGVLTFGLPYPPLSLLLVLPAQALAGDFRYADVVALAAAALLIGSARRTTLGPPAALLFLFTPAVFFVVRQGWTEPLVVLAFALLVFTAARAPRWLAVPLGAFLAIKQYSPLILPFIWPIVRRGTGDRRSSTRLILAGVALATIVTVPFVIWDLDAFMRSVVALQIEQPFRRDALSYLVALTRPGDAAPLWLLPIAVGLAYLLALVRAPRTPAGLAAATGLVFFAFFAFNKQAFANYYFLVIALLATAAALSDLPDPRWPQLKRTIARAPSTRE